VLWYSLQRLSETSLILITETDIIKMCIGLHVQYPLLLSDINKTRTSLTYFRKILKYQIS